jgi:dTDP-glucose 4,6-dehydratase
VPRGAYLLPEADLAHVVTHGAAAWDALRGTHVIVTGGTGFFGQWLVESLAYAGEVLELGVRATVLTRDPDAALARAGRAAPPAGVTYLRGDVRDVRALDPAGPAEWCIHAATDASPVLNAEAPEAMLATIVDGTRAVLDYAGRQSLRGLLVCSSGAVYGRQPSGLSHVPEDYLGGPDVTDPAQAYAEGKRVAELATAIAARRGVPATIARCFAFVGPFLPLDGHFAVGNFVRDRLAGRPIAIGGDGTAVRSYLHAADLAVWLWTLLVHGGRGRAYNVGSERAVSIDELARVVAGAGRVEPLPVARAREPVPGAPAHRYVPATDRARAELGLRERIDLEDAVARTLGWYATTATRS